LNFSRLIIVFEASQIKEDFIKGILSKGEVTQHMQRDHD
jgi:hypothetical protein